MSGMKIGVRLALGFGVMLVLIALIAGVGLWRVQGSSDATDHLLNVRLTNERLIAEWSKHTSLNAVRTLAAANITDPEMQAALQKDMAATSQMINELQKKWAIC